MQQVCPITDKRINEQVARLNGIVTVILVVLFILFEFWPGMLFLLIDFTLRGFIDNKYSPVCQFNIYLARSLNLTEKPMNAGPKIFAAQVGMLLSALALGAFALNCGTICLVIAGMLGFFSFLESAFGFCVACKLYPFIRRN